MYLICDYKGIIAEVCESPAWIKRQSNGVDVLCPESEAMVCGLTWRMTSL